MLDTWDGLIKLAVVQKRLATERAEQSLRPDPIREVVLVEADLRLERLIKQRINS